MKTTYVFIPIKAPYQPKRVDKSKKTIRYVNLPIGKDAYKPKRLKKGILSKIFRLPTLTELRIFTIFIGFIFIISLLLPNENNGVIEPYENIDIARASTLSFTTNKTNISIMNDKDTAIGNILNPIEVFKTSEVFFKNNVNEIEKAEEEVVIEEIIQEEVQETVIEEPKEEIIEEIIQEEVQETVIDIPSEPSIAAIEQLDPNATIEYLGNYRITGYDPYCDHCCGKSDGITASGAEAVFNYTIAMNDVEFGTKIYIPGYGVYEVQDRGGSSVGVDIARDGHDACYQVTKYDVPVYIVLE